MSLEACPNTAETTGIGVLLAIMLVAVPAGLMGVRWHDKPSRAKPLPPWDNRLMEWLAPSKSPRAASSSRAARPAAGKSPFSVSPAESPDSGSSTVTSDATAGPDSNQVEESAQFSPPTLHGLQDTVRRLPGANALAWPEVVKQLQLTDVQQERIHQLIEDTSRAIRGLDRELSGEQRQQMSELRGALLDQARREAIDLLTPQQRAKWEKLNDKP